MCTINGPRILGKIELPYHEQYNRKGYESTICVCCGESSGSLYKQGNGQWAHNDCVDVEIANYYEEQANAQQRYQDRLNTLKSK